MFGFVVSCKAQKLNYQGKISVSRYEVFKACGLLGSHSDYYYKRLNALKRFVNSFVKKPREKYAFLFKCVLRRFKTV
jgi:hypothetical protein